MSDNLEEVSLEVLQHRLIEEVEAQQRLQEELRVALESEKQLRLENDVLWAHLEDRHPGRLTDARDMLARLTEGGELTHELKRSALAPSRQNRTLRQRVRRKIGTLPGVHKMYHGLKNLRK
ncbi:hypothetical protein GCM10023190_06220 [Enteractinococcus fodinae]|uniref:DNA-binding FrmR family transcriptional regulator n=1 Tax=Enteractinococcus fodinae TaxID=684663 RepID=A0ABU2B3B4_9MICC|nr:hypothetical protein [Enteractinococcus fodinae]MDR7346899.1 DNA-binding FrmR family transcriptional regulator [Enteractinococcus fodinae]